MAELEDKEPIILWDKEMIDTNKRRILVRLGLLQFMMYGLNFYGPSVDYSELPLIPTDRFITIDGKYSIIYDKFIDRMLILDEKWARGIDDGLFYNWETGLERLKKLLKDGK